MYPDIVHGWGIAEEHLAEGAFLLGRVQDVQLSPRHVLAQAAELEQRVLAHLDGLMVGGARVAEHLLKPSLAAVDPLIITAAAAALLGQREGIESVLKLLHEGTERQCGAIGSALLGFAPVDLLTRLASLLPSVPAPIAALFLECLGTRRADPGPGLQQCLASKEPEVLASALRCARAALARVDPATVLSALRSPMPGVREAGLETGAVLGLRQVWAGCRSASAGESQPSRRELELLALGSDEAEVEGLLRFAAIPALREDAVWALGFSGRLVVAQAALAWMRDDDKRFSRLAGEAFSAITGLKLEGRFVRQEQPDDGPVPLEDEELDADLVPRPEDALPLPEPDAVEDWWKKARSGFEPGRRYLRGQLFGVETFLDALAQAPMRRRHLLALELAIRTRGQHWLETRGPIHQQRAWLARNRALPTLELRLPFKQLLTLG